MADEGIPRSAFESDGWWGYEIGGTGAGRRHFGRIPGTVAAGDLTVSGEISALRRFGRETSITIDPQLLRYSHRGLRSRALVSRRLQGYDLNGTIEYFPANVSGGSHVMDALTRVLGSSLVVVDDEGATDNPWFTGYRPRLRAHVPSWFAETEVNLYGQTAVENLLLLAGCKTNELRIEVSPPEGMKNTERFMAQDATFLFDSSSKRYSATADETPFSATNYFANTVGNFTPNQYGGGDVTSEIIMLANPGLLSGLLQPYNFDECGVLYTLTTQGATYADKASIDAGTEPLNLRKWTFEVSNDLDRKRTPNSKGRSYAQDILEGAQGISVDLEFDMLNDKVWRRDAFKRDRLVNMRLDLGDSGEALYLRNGVIQDPSGPFQEGRVNLQKVKVEFTDPNRSRDHVTVETI